MKLAEGKNGLGPFCCMIMWNEIWVDSDSCCQCHSKKDFKYWFLLSLKIYYSIWYSCMHVVIFKFWIFIHKFILPRRWEVLFHEDPTPQYGKLECLHFLLLILCFIICSFLQIYCRPCFCTIFMTLCSSLRLFDPWSPINLFEVFRLGFIFDFLSKIIKFYVWDQKI